VKALVLTLRQRPEQRLDLSSLVPHLIAGKRAAEIERIEVQTTRTRVLVGDAFRLRMGDVGCIRIEQACDRLDRIGYAMVDGEVIVDGDAGYQTGRLMRGGTLRVAGNAGHWAASGLRGGTLEISGDAGDHVGAPFAGETAGMRGGLVVVRGDVGNHAADRMRRGTLLVEGGAGRWTGSRMIAGTVIARRKVGALPGYLMRRGTIVLMDGTDELSPTFVDCGVHDLVALRLLAAFVKPYSPGVASGLRHRMRRLAGDMAVSPNGEILIA
jgi:formylmethanofuran dehydrogenase subunit C